MLWSSVVDVVRGLLFVLAHWCGGSFGLAIVVASCAARLAILPLTLAATRRRLERARDKVTTPDPRSLLDALVQLPLAAALYAAIRGAGASAGSFLWIANLARPDRALAVVAGLSSAALSWMAMSPPAGRAGPPLVPVLLPAVITILILTHFSAGAAVYSFTNSLIGAAERFVAGRTLRPAKA
jgi:membrane protein insertase Oxa1/YidC/SpoIIIJ